jgi:O-acetylhomoserine/O-acetylserine sulfhydrylase-like pyridoxal-dependent enzyme
MKNGLSPETLAAQALGDTEPAFRGLVPPIYPSTAYERDTDGTYPSGRAYTRADNPTYDHAEDLLAALEGEPAASCSPPAARRPRPSSSPCSPAITSSWPGSSTGGSASGWPSSR